MSQASFFEEEKKSVPDGAVRKRVLVPYPVDKAYDYAVPDGMVLEDGDYVTVPLSGREVPGVVWGDADGDVKKSKLKSVVERHDVPPMPAVHRDFIDWVAGYTVSAKGAVLKMALSVPKALTPDKPVVGYTVSSQADKANVSAKQRAVLDVLSDGVPRRASEIADGAGCSPGVVKTLVKKGLVVEREMHGAPPCRKLDLTIEPPILSPGQAEARDRIFEYMNGGGVLSHKALLLDGVTGAGKTAVYFEAVAQALQQDKQVLILVPEIALSNAFIGRFKDRFGCAPALWHSELGAKQRRQTWRGVVQGRSKVVIGARSALFLPYADLGLIVVDEEHDPAYKQEEGVIYNARDMAIVRGHLGKNPVVLVSATPSLETMHNVWEGRYAHVHLPDRFGGARLPDIHTIDLREDKPERQHFISPTLKKAVVETLQKGEQALLFLNRRGYAPLTLCRTCGHRLNCPRCSAWLVDHKRTGKLHCHHCDYHVSLPDTCPACEDRDSFAVCGPGVERIHEEARVLFPDARIMVLASDTTDSQDDLKKMLKRIQDGEIDLVIGTQIIAKGHHFPHLTCVGVIDADLGLSGGELRGAERVYQLLHQVAGRAGRESKRGVAYLQTFMPEHKVMQALSHCGHIEDHEQEGKDELGEVGRDMFLRVEAEERSLSGMPPYTRLAGIIISGREERDVIQVAQNLGRCAPQSEDVQVFGPVPAPFAKLRGRYRYRLLVRAQKNINIQKTIKVWVAGVNKPSKVRIQVDIDPQSFM